MNVVEEDYLEHTGVLGMHWGKHKRVDSSEITKAKNSIADNQQKLKLAKKTLNKQTMYGLIAPTQKSLKGLSNANREFKYSKQDLASVKILEKLNSKEKSSSQLSMEEKYKSKGMDADQAAVAAYQNIRTKKILIGVGATVLAAGVGYAAYKIHDDRVDKIIKSGKLLQNISGDDTAGVRDAFYSSGNKLDNIKYKGLYGDSIQARQGAAFKKEIKAISDIKQISPHNAIKALSDLVKNDPEFAKEVKAMTDNTGKLGAGVYYNKFKKASESMSKGVVDKNVYEVLNASLVDHSPEMQKITDKYFGELSKKGYNAIRDVNDNKYSGYGTINPIIAFNTKGKVDVVNVKQLVDSDIKKARNIAYASISASQMVKQGAIIATGIFAAKKGSSATKQIMDDKWVKKYRDKYPKSEMTNKEIVRMLERGNYAR